MKTNVKIFEKDAFIVPTKVLDAVRKYAIRKLAQQLYDCVECSSNPRDKIDWETAQRFVDQNRQVVVNLTELDMILRISYELKISLQCQPMCDRKQNFLNEFKKTGKLELEKIAGKEISATHWDKLIKELNFEKWACDDWQRKQCRKEQTEKAMMEMDEDKMGEIYRRVVDQEINFDARDAYLGRPIWDSFYQKIKIHLPREHYTKIKYS